METKNHMSDHDESVIKACACLVEGQTSKFVGGEGQTYTGHVIRVDDECNMTIVKKDNKVIARFVYDFETGIETRLENEDN